MKKRVLVVDDELPILELLKFKLSRQAFDVVTAKDAQEFWDRALEQKPDLIILDIWLGDRIGTLVYEELLRSGFDPDVPVIFITALLEGGEATRAPQAGRYALYGKPFDFEKLGKEIKRMIAFSEQASSPSTVPALIGAGTRVEYVEG